MKQRMKENDIWGAAAATW